MTPSLHTSTATSATTSDHTLRHTLVGRMLSTMPRGLPQRSCNLSRMALLHRPLRTALRMSTNSLSAWPRSHCNMSHAVFDLGFSQVDAAVGQSSTVVYTFRIEKLRTQGTASSSMREKYGVWDFLCQRTCLYTLVSSMQALMQDSQQSASKANFRSARQASSSYPVAC